MLTVACVLKSGGWCGPADVVRLSSGVARHLSVPHNFMCLTDFPPPQIVPHTAFRAPAVNFIALQHGWPGWWSKLELFRPDVFTWADRVLYFDLDTVIVGDLSDIACYEGPFAMLSDFYRPDRAASGVMAWEPGRCDQIFAAFKAKPLEHMARHWGDQPFIEQAFGARDVRRLQHEFPGQFVSYKVACGNGVPFNARVICFHGQPRPGAIPAGHPVAKEWLA